MICPNCGRRNSAGATFCSRCHQRLPLANKLNGNQRRVVMVEPRGGGGSGAVVLGVALLAGFLFIGGAAAIYLSNPPGTANPTDIAYASGSPTLPPFVQPTATPSPTPTPTFILLPSDSPASFSPLPTDTTGFPTPLPTPQPTPQRTPPPTGGPPTATPRPTPVPTPKPVVAKFTFSVNGFDVQFTDQSKGGPTQWLWDFGDGSPQATEQNPQHSYAAGEYRSYTVKLIVTGPGGTSTWTRKVTFQPPATPTPTPTQTLVPSPTPTPTSPTLSEAPIVPPPPVQGSLQNQTP
ncbi:MAG: PKD domain-containing protein [Chloroflexota bacterium]